MVSWFEMVRERGIGQMTLHDCCSPADSPFLSYVPTAIVPFSTPNRTIVLTYHIRVGMIDSLKWGPCDKSPNHSSMFVSGPLLKSKWKE